jgi:membrane associated rhomboid family serine protease
MSRSSGGGRKNMSPEVSHGGWSWRLVRRSYCALTLSAITVATCIVQSLIGWKPVLNAIGFVSSAVWSPSTWFSVLPGQSIPVVLTWFAYVFPHLGWWHMAGNTAMLVMVGGTLEHRIGTRNFAVVALLSIVSGAFALAIIHPHGITPSGGGSLLLCNIFGVRIAMYYQTWWRRHPRATLALEVAAIVLVVLWLLWRTTPLAPSFFLALMWHVIPLMIGWVGYRVVHAVQARKGNAE